MKRILIVCVNYNSYEHLMNYLDSIEKAKLNCFNCTIDVYIADNSTEKQDVIIDKYNYINIKIFKFPNLGYLGGASAIINNEVDDIHHYDFVIISNVDVLASKDAFYNLTSIPYSNDIAWISPKRYSTSKKIVLHVEKKDRPTKLKLNIMCLIYKYPLIKSIQNWITWKKYHLKQSQKTEREEIYVGAGSFIILTKTFFKEYPKIEYPMFLYGEELFFAELIRNKGLKVIYEPDVLILNEGEVSTKHNTIKHTSKLQYDAMKYIKTTFFKN